MKHSFNKLFVLLLLLLVITGCTIYTEKRSEALSQAVYATSTSISNARIDFAAKYAEQAKRLAYAPKKQIEILPIVTDAVKTIEAINTTTKIRPPVNSSSTIPTNVITATSIDNQDQKIIRLVIPEFLKHAKLLIENSEEWNELIKNKQLNAQLEQDKSNLQKLAQDIDAELTKQQKYNSELLNELHRLKTAVAEKQITIYKLYITTAVLIGLILGGVYLRIKGIL
jgi:hypothetical protein